MHLLALPSTRLAYLEQGSGDPVIFVHGTVSDLRSWKLQLVPFGATHRAIAYSRRYHFPNAVPLPNAPYSAALHAEDLGEVLDALGIGRAHLVGGSFGGYVSLVCALAHPERVRSLVLAEPPILPLLNATEEGSRLLKEFDEMAWIPARLAFQRNDHVDAVRRFIDGVMGKGAFDGYTPAAQKRLLDNAPELRAETESEEYFTAVSEPALRGLSLPVLLLNGEQSPRMFRLVTDELERHLPNAKRVMIPNASHGMNVQNAAAFNQAVAHFLAST